jgi:galactoside 2-L-fucosyltransferase 1/2
LERRFYVSWPWQEHFVSEIKYLFTFSDTIIGKAKKILQEISVEVRKKYTQRDSVYIGVHVRRGDKVKSKYHVSDVQYFVKAMEFCQKQYHPKKCIFLVGSDIINWCKEHFKIPNIYYLSGSPSEDMATLTECNHTIISDGSFSIWTGFLTKGIVYGPRHMASEFQIYTNYVTL